MRFQAIVVLVLFMSQKAWTCQHGDIRFLNQGALPSRCYYHGTVEVCLSGTWGTVCSNHWDSTDAGVACIQLGHSRNGAAAHRHQLTSQPIHLNNVNCSGSELRVIDCQYSSQTSACSNFKAGVRCHRVVTGCPRNAEITALSPTTINISWSPPLTMEIYGTIMWYKVICASHSSYTQTANNLTLAIAGLHPYTHYTCCISAITSVDEGTTACNSTVTPEAAPTASPQNLRQGASDSTSLFFYWNPPPSWQQNGRIRHYQIRVTEETTNILKSSGISSNSGWTVTDLEPYTRYRCAVAAVTVAQGPSAVITIQTKESAPTAIPQSLTQGENGSTSLSFYWSPPPSRYRNGWIRHYQIRVTEETTNILKSSGISSSTQWTVSNLNPYTRYRCGVAAVTVAQGPSAFITIQTSQSAPTAAPQNVRGTATGTTSLFLYWSPPPSQDQNGRIQYYYINMTDETTNTLRLLTTSSTSLTVSSLYPYSMYRCTVAAVTVAQGPPSTPITIQTHQDVPTVAPTVNSMVRRNATTILITLQPLTRRESRGIVTLYNITYRGFEPLSLACNRSNSALSTTPAATYVDRPYAQLLVDQLDPRLIYCLEVAAATSVGVGPSSEPIAVDLYSNDPFQVHLSGVLHCDHWLAYRPLSKWNEISQVIAEAVQRQCYCPFTSEYIADARLMCSKDGLVVFQGRIISTNSPPNRELLKYVQEWVRSMPTVIIEGVHLHISDCSVHLNELGSTDSAANCTKPGLSTVGISFIITVPALLVIIVVTSAVICSVYCWKKHTITEDRRDGNPPKGHADDVDEPKTSNEYSNQHSIRKGGNCKSTVKPETIELTCRKPTGAAVAQDTSLPHQEIQNGLPKEDKGLPILPPRLYLKDEDFTTQLHDCTMQTTATDSQEKAVCFEVCGNVIQTHEVPKPTVDENAIYQPLLPHRIATEDSSVSSVYQPLTFTNHKEEEEKSKQSATGNENSTYQPLIFKSTTRNREQNEEERGQLTTVTDSSETSHYQPLVFTKERKKLYATHVMMTFLSSEPTQPDSSSNRKSNNSTGSSARV